MRWFVGWSLRSRFVVIALAVGLTVLAVTQLGQLSVDTLPEFGPTRVEVQTEALGLSAEEVEQLITVPLEQDLLNGVAFLDEIESASLPGLSSVVMTFEPGTDLLDARQVVQERLTQAHALPQVADPPQMLQPLSSTSRIAMIRLSSSELTPIETSVLARWVIVPRLLGVEGVANVSMWGFRDRQLQVLVDPEELSESEVPLSQVIRTAGNALEVSPLSFLEASQPGTGGWIDTLNQRLHIFHEQAITSPDELAQVPLESADGDAVLVDGEPVALGEVAEVVEDHQPLIGDAHCQGGPCLLLVLEKFPGANTPEVARGVQDAMDTMAPGLAGVEYDTSIYRPADYIETAFGNLAIRLLIGAVLLLIALAVVFRDWRRVLIAAVAVPVALAVGALVLYVMDATVNMIVVAGFAAGLAFIVDDAVTDVAAISHSRRSHAPEGNGGTLLHAILSGSARARSAALYTALIVAAALLPLYFAPGTAGAFLPPLATAYVLAVAASMLVALTVTPAVSMLVFRRASRRDEVPTVATEDRYGRASRRLLGRATPALATFGVLLAVGVIALPFLDTSMRPALQERDVLLHLEASPGTSLARMDQVVAGVVDEVAAIDGVRDVGAHVGRAVTSDQVVNVNEGEVWIDVAPEADYDQTLASIDAVADGLADISHELTTYSEQRVSAVLGSEDALTVRVYGENEALLREKAEDVRAAVAGVDGVEEAIIDTPPEEPAISVVVDLERAREHGVKPGDVRRAAAVMLSGITVGNLFEEQKVFDVVVWGAPDIRATPADVRELLIDTPTGEPVTLGEVADVTVEDQPSVVRHHSVMSFLDVTAEVGGRGVRAVATDVEDVIRDVDFPLEYHAEVLGDFADEAAAWTRVVMVAIASVLAIFLLLQAAFASWRLSMIAFVSLLPAMAGGLVVAWITGGTIGLGTVVGLAAVLGVATRAIILLVRRYQQLERLEGLSFGPDLVVHGTRERLVPILGSALAVAAVMAPFAVAGGAIGLEIVQPMAVVVLGGLVSSLLVSLVVVPWLYLRFGFIGTPDTTSEDLIITIPEAETPRPMASSSGP